MIRNFLVAATFVCAAAAQAATAPVTVQDAWARASVQGQSASGAYMTLTAREPLTLVGASSPVAGEAGVHEMKMDGEVMRMRPVPALTLPAGKAVELKPNGYHVMLTDLKAPLKPNTHIPLTLHFRNAKGVESALQLSVPVSMMPPMHAAGAMPGMSGMHDMHGQ
jgi:hypothetical protein